MYKKVKDYIETIDGISHTTFDPHGPGVVRIHLVPPEKIKLGLAWTIILNGQDVIPITFGWAVLLREFINAVNKRSGVALEDEEIVHIINEAIEAASKVFDKTNKKTLRADLKQIVETLTKIARKEKISEIIEYAPLSTYAKYMAAPHRMDLMISAMSKNGAWHCNQKCLNCYAAGQIQANVEEIDTESWKKIIDKCKASMIPQLTFTGGEPTLRPDLVELVNYSQWFVTRLNTNGQLLSKELCAKLYEASLDSVQVTLYSHKKEIHNLLVGADGFDKTIEGIKNATCAKLNVSINTPLCDLNKDYADMVKYAHEVLGVNYFTCSGLILTGNATDTANSRLSKAEILNVLKEAKAYTDSNNCELSFTSPGWIDSDILRKMKMMVPSCGACSSNMAITPNGMVVPCQSWLSDTPLGNMLTDEWKKIWNSRRCVKLRKDNSKANDLCPLSGRIEGDTNE
ncbi:MAG: radical SAM protein [Bacilli bacterium]|nr:radical SAM protein [Bacilli bacterium]